MFEVDYLHVGDDSCSGDAIALRYGNFTGSRGDQTVVVIDGGTKDSGERLVKHIQEHYKTDTVDFVVSTHPDRDHASGLELVLENLKVGTLLMHRPWEHTEEIRSMFKNGRLTSSGLEDALEKSLQHASDLEAIATRKNITIVEPFAGVASRDGAMRFLGPDRDYYRSLLPLFRGAPVPKLGLLQQIGAGAKDVIQRIAESLEIETLNDTGETSAENNTSSILLLNVDGHRLLFTGDAGIPALNGAMAYAEEKGIDLSNIEFFDVPHHGSRRNLGPTILNKLNPKVGYISAAVNGLPKHPAKKVTNALIRRGCQVFATQGKGLCHSFSSQRAGWSPAPEVPFYDEVEE